MATASKPSYQLLVANFSRPNPSPGRGADPVVSRPTKVRSGFVFRHVQNIGLSDTLTNATKAPSHSVITQTINGQWNPFDPVQAPQVEVEIVSNVFEGTSASLFLGEFELISNRDYLVGGGAGATATALGDAINNLPGYSAVVGGTTISVSGPRGQVTLEASARYRGGERNFDFTYPDTTKPIQMGFDPGTDAMLPPTIIPPASLQGEPYDDVM